MPVSKLYTKTLPDTTAALTDPAATNLSHGNGSSSRDEKRTGIRAQVEERQTVIVQELCESRGGRPGLSVLTSLLVSVDVKLY